MLNTKKCSVQWALLATLLACGCMKDKAPATENTSAEAARPAKQATPSIASVVLAQDCPDPPGSLGSPPEKAKAKREARAKSDSDQPFQQPCTQSSIQLAFADQGEQPGSVRVKAVRFWSAEESKSPLATLQARMPARWSGQSYGAWDEIVPADSTIQATYKLSAPDWSTVESKVGGSSYGRMYLMEVDVEVSGKVSTIRSAKFERQRPQILKT